MTFSFRQWILLPTTPSFGSATAPVPELAPAREGQPLCQSSVAAQLRIAAPRTLDGSLVLLRFHPLHYQIYPKPSQRVNQHLLGSSLSLQPLWRREDRLERRVGDAQYDILKGCFRPD
jgi:hypothetical protein